jgi:uncharacterized phiE125 gp8 family phage protein
MKKILNSISRSGEKIIIDPTSLASIKSYLRVDNNFEDDLICTIVDSAISQFEEYTLLALIENNWTISYKNFSEDTLKIPVRNISKILTVKTLSHQNCIHEINLSQVILNKEFNSVSFKVVPLTRMLRIEFVAGITDKFNSIPSNIKTCLLEHIAFLYDNRSAEEQFDLKKYSKFKRIGF